MHADQRKHETVDCVHRLSRDQILSEADEHNSLEECTLCQKSVKQREMNVHMEKHCMYRVVTCPNIGDGCTSDEVYTFFKFPLRRTPPPLLKVNTLIIVHLRF